MTSSHPEQSSGTREIIAPILRETYGKGRMVDSLADHLAQKIDAWPDAKPRFGVRNREDMICMTCWDWFSGGTTAESIAKEIETALDAFESGAFL